MVILLVISTNTFGQTEIQTRLWLKDKIEKYFVFGRKIDKEVTEVTVEPCYIEINIFEDNKLITKISFNPSASKWTYADGIIFSNTENILYKCEGCIWEESRESISYRNDLKFISGESNIYERMIKALNHLATFCKEGKGETF